MKQWITVLLLLLGAVPAQAQLRKQRLFKVDPASFIFKEIRVAVEHRLFKDRDYFWYLAPYGYHQFWKSRDSDPYGRPLHPQKYYGLGIRAGARRYFLPKASSPHGFFVHVHAGARQLWLHQYSTDLKLTDRTWFFQPSLGGTVGYQWITGPRKDFVYGWMGGFEYFFNPAFPASSAHQEGDLTSNWYEFPFLDGGHSGFRLYIGIELGFAFLQKHLHW